MNIQVFWPETVIHSGVQLIAVAILLLSGSRAHAYRPGETQYKFFYLITILLSGWTLLELTDDISELLFGGSRMAAAIGEIMLLFTGPLMIYISLRFPTGRKRKLKRKTIRPNKRFRSFYIAESISFLLSIAIVFHQIGENVTGNDRDASLRMLLTLNRLFIVTTFAFAAIYQARIYRNPERSSRRIHIRMFTGSLVIFLMIFSTDLFFIWNFPKSLTAHALVSVLLPLPSLILSRVMRNLPVDIRLILGKTIPVLLTGFAFASILYFLTFIAPSKSLSVVQTVLATAVASSIVHAVLVVLTNRIFEEQHHRHLLEGAAMRAGENVYDGGQRLILDFFSGLYHPGFFCVYFAEEDRNRNIRYLIMDRESLLIKKGRKSPPSIFPEDILELMETSGPDFHSGALIADIIGQSEKTGSRSVRNALRNFSACGGEILIPAFQIIDSHENPSGQISSRKYAAVILFGELPDGRPVNHSHLREILAISPLLHIALQNEIINKESVRLKTRIEEDNRRISRKIGEHSADKTGSFSAASFVYRPDGVMSEIMEQAERFAHRNAPVLITGETGTGKEHIARIVHTLSGLKGDFVAFNSSAVPPDLIENELFGHAKGAYTGAEAATDGFVGRAKEGVLFMDEIGELSPEGQVKLLRLVQDGEYEKLGSPETMKTDARFIFATNRNLEEDVQKGRFRSDLYYRISTFEIRIPPLRQRKDDIPLLVDHFLWIAKETFHRPGLNITSPARELLIRYRWPGNVRELENVIMRSVVLNDSDTIAPSDLPDEVREEADFFRKRIHLEKITQEQSRLERELLIEALKQAGGNQRKAAEMLNISRGSLQYRMKQYDLTQD